MTGIPAHTTDDGTVPVCPCGEVMTLFDATNSWACPKTLDDGGTALHGRPLRGYWGRPTRGHTHYLAAEDVGRRSLLKEA